MNTLQKLCQINAIAIATVIVSMGAAQAQTNNIFINFEDAAQRGLGDNQAITNQYADLGFSFGIDNNNDGLADAGITPMLELVGQRDSVNGFVNSGKGNDVAEAGLFDAEKGITYEQRLGNYFLRTAGLGGNGGNLLISYSQASAAASGELWDIDGNKRFHKDGSDRTEQWAVQALGANGNILDTLLSPIGDRVDDANDGFGALDGKPWLWSFERETNDIHAIRFVFTGHSAAANVGLAFDNFSAYSVEGKEPPAAVPEPATIIGSLVALGGGAIARKRNKR